MAAAMTEQGDDVNYKVAQKRKLVFWSKADPQKRAIAVRSKKQREATKNA